MSTEESWLFLERIGNIYEPETGLRKSAEKSWPCLEEFQSSLKD